MSTEAMESVPVVNWREFRRRGDELLRELQESLLPEHANDIVAIDVDSGGYVLAQTRDEATRKFREKFPGQLFYRSRVDGGPVIKYHDRVKR